jgi:hypothetical protein
VVLSQYMRPTLTPRPFGNAYWQRTGDGSVGQLSAHSKSVWAAQPQPQAQGKKMLSCGIWTTYLFRSSHLLRQTNIAVAIDSKRGIFAVMIALVSLTAYMQRPRPDHVIYPDRVIYVNGGKYICSDVGVNNALKALPPTGGTVDVRGCEGTMPWASNVFSGVSAPSGKLLLGNVTVTLSAQQVPPPQWKIEGIPSTAGGEAFSRQVARGTVFVWSGAPNTAMFEIFDQFGVILDGLSFYCGTFAMPIAGCTDILVDSDDAAHPYPGADFTQILNTSHYNFPTGISVNSATRGCGGSGCDTSAVTIQNANFGSTVSGAEGIVSWSANGGSSSLFDRIFCQDVVACIEIKDNIGGTVISRLDAGELEGTNAAAILLSGGISQFQ